MKYRELHKCDDTDVAQIIPVQSPQPGQYFIYGYIHKSPFVLVSVDNPCIENKPPGLYGLIAAILQR